MTALMATDRGRNISEAVSAYGKKLFGFIRNRVPTNADAEDIFQDVWYQFSNVVDTESIEQVSGWLFRVARNRVTDSFRKKKPELIEDFNYEDSDGESYQKQIFLADFPAPEDEELREVFWEELYAALEELPEDQKNVFIWNELENKTFQDIADDTGVNIKTLISRKGYAVKHLRKRLEALYQELLFD